MEEQFTQRWSLQLILLSGIRSSSCLFQDKIEPPHSQTTQKDPVWLETFCCVPWYPAEIHYWVKTRFQVLEEDDNVASYAKFVEANRQAMEECVPHKLKEEVRVYFK